MTPESLKTATMLAKWVEANGSSINECTINMTADSLAGTTVINVQNDGSIAVVTDSISEEMVFDNINEALKDLPDLFRKEPEKEEKEAYETTEEKAEAHDAATMCVLCGQPIKGHGNNAEPLAKGLCCNECNKKVISERLKKMQAKDVIKKKADGFHVESEKGKNLGGPYKTEEEAKKRLQQVHYFKHKGKDEMKLGARLLEESSIDGNGSAIFEAYNKEFDSKSEKWGIYLVINTFCDIDKIEVDYERSEPDASIGIKEGSIDSLTVDVSKAITAELDYISDIDDRKITKETAMTMLECTEEELNRIIEYSIGKAEKLAEARAEEYYEEYPDEIQGYELETEAEEEYDCSEEEL